MTLDEMLKVGSQRGASDLLLMVGDSPAIRVAGEWERLSAPMLRRDDLQQYIMALMDTDQIEMLKKTRELDFSRNIAEIGRIRVNVHYQRDHLALVIRLVWPEIPSSTKLGIPANVFSACNAPNGLILVSGSTGSGKSTTLASMVEHINRQRSAHIITIEDPIEFIYRNGKSIIEQREIGSDTLSWGNALRNVLRQAPDVIVLGELRDLESISIALMAAETGHLVMASVHGSTAHGALLRITDVFPASQISQVRLQLSQSIRMVFAQRLLPSRVGTSRVLSYEILMGTPAVQNLIRSDELEQIPNMISAGRDHGMISFGQCQRELINKGLISAESVPLARVG